MNKKLLRKKLALMLANLKKKRPFYTEVEFLESTGTQWIDTGINVDTSTDEIKLYFQLTETNNYKWFFGEYDTNNRLGLGSGDGENKRNFLYQQTATKVSDTQMYNTQHLFEINSNGCFLDGTKIRDYANFASTSTIYLFNLNIDSPSDYRCKSKIWRYEHKRNGVLIRDMIPVLDWDMTPCMYDKVSGQLFYNQDTGSDFTVGRQIHYVDYLESTGTQYIDTGIQPTDDYGYKIKNTYTVGSGEQCAIGCMDGGNRFVGIYTSGSTNAVSGAWGSFVGFLPNYPWTTGTVLEVKCNYKNDRKIIIDQTEMKDITHTHISGTISNTIYLFARNYGSTITKMVGKMYGAEITNGQNIVGDFIPMVDENGVGAMFDAVSHAIYDNAGTGSFGYTPVELEYLESTGTQRINTGIPFIAQDDYVIKTRSVNFDVSKRSAIISNYYNDSYTSVTLEWWAGGSVQEGKARIYCRTRDYTSGYINVTSPTALSINTPHDLELEYLYSSKTVILHFDGDTETGTIPTIAIPNSTYNWCLFLDERPSTSAIQNPTRIYYLQIYHNNTLVRDFIPVYYNGQTGMWDKANEVFYPNVGTGTFTTSKIVEPKYE